VINHQTFFFTFFSNGINYVSSCAIDAVTRQSLQLQDIEYNKVFISEQKKKWCFFLIGYVLSKNVLFSSLVMAYCLNQKRRLVFSKCGINLYTNTVFCPKHHATGEAFIGQEKCSVMTASGLGFREVYFITWYWREKNSPSKFINQQNVSYLIHFAR